MAKKKNETAPTAAAPAPGPAPSAEELRRQHVETNAKNRLDDLIRDLEELGKHNFRKAESLRALEQAGVRVVELALQTRGRMRAADGRGDAFLEATAANVRTALRHADKIMEGHDVEMTAWADALEIASPAIEDLKRISKAMERPGIKVAIVPGGGEGLFDEEGQPTQAAAADPEPVQPAPEPDPEPAAAPPREIPTLGMAEPDPVIDVEPEPAHTHALDGLDESQAEEATQTLLSELEDEGAREGLKRRDWKAAEAEWMATWPEDCDAATTRAMYDRITFALDVRKPLSWAVVTEKDLIDWQRKQALALLDPGFDLAKEA